jgi:hypothetical protein
LPIVRTIVFEVPITPSPMIMRPRSPRRSPICVALKDNFRHVMEMARVPRNSTVSSTYTAINRAVMFISRLWKPPNNPANTAATHRKSDTFSASGSVRRCVLCFRVVHMMAVTRYCRASHERLRSIAKHKVRYICLHQLPAHAKHTDAYQRTQCVVSICMSLATGMYL